MISSTAASGSWRGLTIARLLLSGLLVLSSAVLAFDLPGHFDPQRDAAKDLAAASVMASGGGRNIILDVGGEWCVWCHILDRFFDANPDAATLRDHSFVWLKVNFSPENKNRAFLKSLPRINGYPHLFVLDSRGALLHSQGTHELEEGRGYNRSAVMDFLRRWGPAAVSPGTK